MTRSLWLILGLVACGWFASAEPSENETLWQTANDAYEAGQYDQAAAAYERLLDMGVRNGWVHFNLGNAYFRLNQLGKAIVHYYRAQTYLPNDPDVRHNLNLANQKRVDPQIDEEKDSFFSTADLALKRMPYSLTFYAALIFLVLAGAASFALIIRREANRPLGYVLVVCGVFGILLTGLAKVQYGHLTRQDFAVVVADEVHVLSGPSPRETTSFTVHEGIRCQILAETEDWVRIRLANGYNGWMLKTKIERI